MEKTYLGGLFDEAERTTAIGPLCIDFWRLQGHIDNAPTPVDHPWLKRKQAAILKLLNALGVDEEGEDLHQ